MLNPVSDALKPVIASLNPFYRFMGDTLGGGEPFFAICSSVCHLSTLTGVAFPKSSGTHQTVFTPNKPQQRADGRWRSFDLQDKYGFIIARTNAIRIHFDGTFCCLRRCTVSERKTVMFTSRPSGPSNAGSRSLYAADAEPLKNLSLHRTYHGSAMSILHSVPVLPPGMTKLLRHIQPPPCNRKKFEWVILSATGIWRQITGCLRLHLLKVPDGDDLAFARHLWQSRHPSIARRYNDTKQATREGYVRIALSWCSHPVSVAKT